MSLIWETLTLSQGETQDTPCDCCGKVTRFLDGEVDGPGGWLAYYWVRHSQGHLEVFPQFRLFVGDWSETAKRDQRWAVGAHLNRAEEGFMLADLSGESSEIEATYLNRDDVIGTPYASDVFAIIDAIFMKDQRLEELHP